MATTSGAGEGSNLRGLDRQQREAVTTDAAPLAIIAAAGSGKTTVLTRRIAHRLATGSADASHIVALTFTRDAAGELHRRLRRLDVRTPIEAGTFHAVCRRLLRDRALAANRPMPAVANDRRRVLTEALNDAGLRLDPTAVGMDIDWARARLVAGDGFGDACRQWKRRPHIPPNALPTVMAAYSTAKRRRGVVDFDDLLDGVLDAMRTDSAFADAVRWRFRHFFVDEAQDLNPLQHAVLEAWRGGRPDICLVGDPRQAIYGWNGSDPGLLDNVEQTYPGVTIVRLRTNYRCSPQVVRAAAAALAPSTVVDETVSGAPDGPSIVVVHHDDEHQEASWAARQIAGELHHRPASDIAVLARTNEQLVVFERALQERAVPTERTTGRTAVDRALAEAYRTPSRDTLAQWAEEAFTGGDAVRRRVAEAVDRFLTSGASGGFRAWVELYTPFDDLISDRQPAVAVTTFHAAKGREWPAVIVAGVESGLVPHSSAVGREQLAEEARLFYVSITRAASRLWLSSATRRGGRPTSPSPWLSAVEATAAHDAVAAPPSTSRARPVDDFAPWRTWRHNIARAAGVDDRAVCSDRVLRSLRDDPPLTTSDLSRRLGITVDAASRLPGRPET